MRVAAVSLLLIGLTTFRPAACQDPIAQTNATSESERSKGTLKSARITGAQSRQAYLEHLCEYLTSKQEAPSAFDLTTVAIVNEWHRDVSYSSVHSVLGTLDAIRAIGLENSAADSKGLEAIWLVETTDKKVWLVSLRDGIVLVASREALVGLPDLFEKTEKICERSQVNVSTNVIDGTVHSIVLLSRESERARICYDLPADIVTTWRELNSALLREDSAVRRQASRQALRD